MHALLFLVILGSIASAGFFLWVGKARGLVLASLSLTAVSILTWMGLMWQIAVPAILALMAILVFGGRAIAASNLEDKKRAHDTMSFASAVVVVIVGIAIAVVSLPGGSQQASNASDSSASQPAITEQGNDPVNECRKVVLDPHINGDVITGGILGENEQETKQKAINAFQHDPYVMREFYNNSPQLVRENGKIEDDVELVNGDCYSQEAETRLSQLVELWNSDQVNVKKSDLPENGVNTGAQGTTVFQSEGAIPDGTGLTIEYNTAGVPEKEQTVRADCGNFIYSSGTPIAVSPPSEAPPIVNVPPKNTTPSTTPPTSPPTTTPPTTTPPTSTTAPNKSPSADPCKTGDAPECQPSDHPVTADPEPSDPAVPESVMPTTPSNPAPPVPETTEREIPVPDNNQGAEPDNPVTGDPGNAGGDSGSNTGNGNGAMDPVEPAEPAAPAPAPAQEAPAPVVADEGPSDPVGDADNGLSNTPSGEEANADESTTDVELKAFSSSTEGQNASTALAAVAFLMLFALAASVTRSRKRPSKK